MVIKWIRSVVDVKSSQLATTKQTAAHRLSSKRSSKKRNSGFVDTRGVSKSFGESELNNLLENVCDSVMPRKPAKPYKTPLAFQRSQSHSNEETGSKPNTAVPWADVTTKLGEEIAVSLQASLLHLQEIALLYPNVAPAIALAQDQIEHARRVAMIAQQFATIESARTRQQSETISLREVVSEAVEQRAAWLRKRGVQVRMGLLDASVHGDAAALYSLIDQLVNWAGTLAPEIGFAIDEISPGQSARLQVFARTDARQLAPTVWQNVGWFMWHQLADTLGAKAELEVSEAALCVSVVFKPLPEPAETTQTKDLELDHDIASIVQGCRVVLIASQPAICESAAAALANLRLDVRLAHSIDAAREALGASVPHAVVFDSRLDPGLILQLRSDLGAKGKVAYVELTDNPGPDFHVSSLGSLSTAHVSLQAIAQSLAPALVFELCKVI